MMTRIKIEFAFIALLSVLVMVFMQTQSLYKTEYIGLDWNPWYEKSLIGITLLFAVFNHSMVKMKVVHNLVISFLSGLLFPVLSFYFVDLFIDFFVQLDHQTTPLGWQFKYRWLDLLMFGLLLVVFTETISVRLTKRKST